MGGAGIIEGVRKEVRRVPFNQYIANYIIDNGDLIEGIRRGLAARKEGKIKPWSKIKEQLDIG